MTHHNATGVYDLRIGSPNSTGHVFVNLIRYSPTDIIGFEAG
jgi:hypothetical protein